ncbi:MAG: ATP-binding protein [Bacteroidetes bacterium]|nr:MAG: ATP-binding protein [Bacteroidota bacterium]
MSSYIQKLILQGEHQKQDFKFQVNDSRKIARTISAFANTDGGKLLIGVKDNGVVAGVRSDEEFHMIEAAAQMYCKPEMDFACRTWNVDGKTVLEIDIPVLDSKPCFAESENGKWLAYIRVGDQNFLASTIQLKYWKRQSREAGTFIRYTHKEKILLDFLNENSFITLNKFCKLASIPKYLAENLIVNLLITGTIEMGQNEKTTWFRLKDPSEENHWDE